MSKLKVATIVGTRPEIIRLSRIISKLDKYCEHTLIHTGQNYDYELNEIFFRDLEIRKPNFFLDVAGETAADTIAAVISKADKIMARTLNDVDSVRVVSIDPFRTTTTTELKIRDEFISWRTHSPEFVLENITPLIESKFP